MLDIQRLIRVVVQLTSPAAAGRTFNTALIIGDSNVISGLERIREYENVEDVATDFGSQAPETLAAELYFGQSPQPKKLYIGRWLRTATAAENLGGILSATQQDISNFNAITDGAFNITVDGAVQTLTGISCLGVTNLNGVATAINGVLTGATASFNGDQFIVKSNSTGAGVKASGFITIDAPPTPLDTLTVYGTAVTFVAANPGADEVLIGASAAATAANLWTFLKNSTDTNISTASYTLDGADVQVEFKTVGTAGNSFTLATSSGDITLSGANLTLGAAPSSVSFATSPGSGTDMSALLKLTSTTAIELVPGYDAESALEAYEALTGANTAWYFGAFACTTFPSNSDYLEIAEFNQALTITRAFGITDQDSNALSALVTNDIGSLLLAQQLSQSFVQFSSTSPYAVCSLIGRACGVDFSQSNSTITLMYKQEPGVVPEDLSNAEANALQAKNVNVYVEYDNNTQLIQYGTVSSDSGYIDQTQGVNWFQNAVQTNCFNVLYTTTTKVAQTDAGAVTLQTACANACNTSINNGLAAPGIWNGPAFGSLKTGDYLKSGFYIYQQSVDVQAQADRAARKAPPIQIALKLAGAFHTADVLVTVNQ